MFAHIAAYMWLLQDTQYFNIRRRPIQPANDSYQWLYTCSCSPHTEDLVWAMSTELHNTSKGIHSSVTYSMHPVPFDVYCMLVLYHTCCVELEEQLGEGCICIHIKATRNLMVATDAAMDLAPETFYSSSK